MTSLVRALESLYPGTHWEITNDDYDQLIWKEEDTPKPTLDELSEEKNRLLVIWNNTEYQRKRQYEYPSWQVLADAMYHQSNGNNAPMEAYLAAVETVKTKYPKP
jgi:hypothetical protein